MHVWTLLQSHWPDGVCGEGHALSMSCARVTLWVGPLVHQRFPKCPVLLSHWEEHLILSSSQEAWQAENAWAKLLLNLCALTGPLRKDTLSRDELWRMPSRERLFKCVKRVWRAHLMAFYSNLAARVFFSQKLPRTKTQMMEFRVCLGHQNCVTWSKWLSLLRPTLLRNNLCRIKCNLVE